ncbi:peptidase S1 [Dietzia alimentaria]|uniref:peptidase S1 n=1 Tax=Dietzia alimentaria TaxID=665550 RepID=UPI0003071435|nr:peptidase S1 [Dietzia alimentaria]
MRPLPRPRQWSIGALLAVAVVTVPVAAQAQPDDGTRAGAGTSATSAIEHHSLEDALAEVGTTRAEFSSESSLADLLAAASAEYTASFPSSFAGVQIVGDSGQIAVVHGADGSDLLINDALARGFTVSYAPAPARELDETADRLQNWADSLPPAQRDRIATIDVDPSTGEVTMVTGESGSAPPPPAELGVSVRPGGFRPAQGSVGSSTAPPDASPGTGNPVDPLPSTLPPDSMVGGSPIYVTSPSGDASNICSLGFNGIRNNKVVNITVAHCSTFADPATSKSVFSPGTISEQTLDRTQLGSFTNEEADTILDAALVTIDSEDQSRFRNSHVRSRGAQPLALSDSQSPVKGQTLCKFGQTTGYTCGKVTGVGSASTSDHRGVEINLCVIAGDSGGVVFSATGAVAVTSLSNAFNAAGAPYSSCDEADRDLRLHHGTVPMMVGVTVKSIESRFPGLQIGAL